MSKQAWTKACVAVVALWVAGTGYGQNTWGFHAGYWSPRDGSDSVGGGMRFGLEAIEQVQLDFRASYFDDLAKDSAGTSAELEVIPLEVALLLHHPAGEALKLYGGGGLGYYLMDGTVRQAGRDLNANPSDKLGFFLTAGVAWGLGPNPDVTFGQTQPILFAELMYRFVKAGNMRVTESEPVVLESARLDGLGVNVGLLISW